MYIFGSAKNEVYLKKLRQSDDFRTVIFLKVYSVNNVEFFVKKYYCFFIRFFALIHYKIISDSFDIE